jgi:hypothetical protein
LILDELLLGLKFRVDTNVDGRITREEVQEVTCLLPFLLPFFSNKVFFLTPCMMRLSLF